MAAAFEGAEGTYKMRAGNGIGEWPELLCQAIDFLRSSSWRSG
jgi:hypothetical protein